MRDSHQPHQRPADELARGYSEIWFSADPNHRGRSHKLLVPDGLRDALQAEAEAFAGEAKSEATAGDQRQHAPAPVPPSETEPKRGSETHTSAGAVFEQEAIWQAYAAATAACRDFHPVFEPAQAVTLYQHMLRYAEEDQKRFAIVYDRLKDLGHLRAVAHPDVPALEQLGASQPHMAPIVEFVRDQIELARHSSRPLHLAPMLLTGEAGIGKTHFAQSLAKALRAPLSIQRLDTDLTSSLLLGSDCKWSNSQHGLLFELLALGKAANPVIVLDEIDKINRRSEQVQSSLYSVLEPVSAQHLRDISLTFEFDASLVTWIATANDASRLDRALLSRFREFHISAPTAEQCLVLAMEVIRATIESAGVDGFCQDTGRIERDIAHLPAREIQQVVKVAIARAVRAGRTHLQRQDLPAHVFDAAEASVHPNGYLH